MFSRLQVDSKFYSKKNRSNSLIDESRNRDEYCPEISLQDKGKPRSITLNSLETSSCGLKVLGSRSLDELSSPEFHALRKQNFKKRRKIGAYLPPVDYPFDEEDIYTR